MIKSIKNAIKPYKIELHTIFKNSLTHKNVDKFQSAKEFLETTPEACWWSGWFYRGCRGILRRL